MTRWPLWRLLIWIEAWLLTVTAVHAVRPIHPDFVVPLLIAVVPGLVVIALRSLARAATDQRTADERRASVVELLIAAVSVAAACWWTVRWGREAHDDLQRIDEMLGQATIIVDVSLTGMAVLACYAALTLDWLLATAHEQLRSTMSWLRRTHVVVTICHVAGLFGSAWLFTNWPDADTADASALFQRARAALHVYEYSKATILPVQAIFAALAVAVVALDSRSPA